MKGQMTVDELFEAIMGRRSRGPVKWCRRCSRKHGSRGGCDLVMVERRAKSGRIVERLAHR